MEVLAVGRRVSKHKLYSKGFSQVSALYVYIYICVYIYIVIYIYRERGREIQIDI